MRLRYKKTDKSIHTAVFFLFGSSYVGPLDDSLPKKHQADAIPCGPGYICLTFE